MTGLIPNARLQNYGSMAGMMREVLSTFLMSVDDMLPAKVISYDRQSNMAQVQPLIMLLKTDGTVQARSPIASIPVLQLGGGNFMLNFNINPGDLGFIKANDRDISIFMQSFEQSPPNTYRKHCFEDAIFIPAPMQNMTINSEDESNVVLSTLDGSQRVAIWEDKIKITSDNEVIIDAPLLRVTGDIAVGDESGGGEATFQGEIRANGDIISDYDDRQISLTYHVHDGVVPGSGETGEPVPE